jgi:hypothetical protein
VTRENLALLVLVFVGGLAIVEVLKTAIERLRPNSLPGPVSGNSFGSGHTMGATMAAALCALMLREPVGRLELRCAVYVTAAGNQRICSRMVVSVNGWRAAEICLVRGWREYHLEPPAGTLRAGDNLVRFQIVAEAGLNPEEPGVGLAPFRYIRLYLRA